MQEKFSVSHNGLEVGPFTKDEILNKINSNELSALDYVYVEAKTDWIPLIELFPARAAGATADAMIKPPSKAPPNVKPPAAKASTQPPAIQPYAAQPPTLPPALPPPVASASKVDPMRSPEMVARVTPARSAPPAATAAPPSREANVVNFKGTAAPVSSDPRPPRATSPSAPRNPEGATTPKSGLIDLKDGVGTFELLHYKAEVLTLALKDIGHLGLDVESSEELLIKAAPATRLDVKGPAECTAGETAKLALEALDQWGNLDAAFSGAVTVRVSGATEGGGEARLASGRGQFAFSTKKAGNVTVKMTDSAKTGLDVSATLNVTYVAGPAARLLIVPPQEPGIAGQPVKVQVQAVDQHGNLATTCSERIKLEIGGRKKTAAA